MTINTSDCAAQIRKFVIECLELSEAQVPVAVSEIMEAATPQLQHVESLCNKFGACYEDFMAQAFYRTNVEPIRYFLLHLLCQSPNTIDVRLSTEYANATYYFEAIKDFQNI